MGAVKSWAMDKASELRSKLWELQSKFAFDSKEWKEINSYLDKDDFDLADDYLETNCIIKFYNEKLRKELIR